MTVVEDEFAAAVVRWLDRQAVSETRLTSFAFREGQTDIEVPASTSQSEIGRWILGIVRASGSWPHVGSCRASSNPIGWR